MALTHRSTVSSAAREFLLSTKDAEVRQASVWRYLELIFGEITPADLTDDEAAELLRALRPAYLRTIGADVDGGASTNSAPTVVQVVPRLRRLHEVLCRVTPDDLSATEALVVLTLLVPAHSRALTQRAGSGAGRPLHRLVVAGDESPRER